MAKPKRSVRFDDFDSSKPYVPPPAPKNDKSLPLWEVPMDVSPDGPITIRVRARTSHEAANLAVTAAYRRPDVWHILDTYEARLYKGPVLAEAD